MSVVKKWRLSEKGEQLILISIQTNDVDAVTKILKKPLGCRLRNRDTPILAAVSKTNMSKYLRDSGYDLWETDRDGLNGLSVLIWSESFTYEQNRRRLEIADLLSTYSNAIEAFFFNADKLFKLVD